MRVARVSTAVAWLVAASGVADARPATISDFATCNSEATKLAGSPSASPPAPDLRRAPRPAPTGTDPSGKIIAGSRDVLIEGMAADRVTDPAYVAAYRECMTRRGITAPPAP